MSHKIYSSVALVVSVFFVIYGAVFTEDLGLKVSLIGLGLMMMISIATIDILEAIRKK